MSDREELISRLSDLGAQSATMTALFQQKAAASYGLGVTDMKALDVLMRGGPQTPGQLGTALSLTSGAITGVVDRLVKRGLAKREADATDRRRVLVAADFDTIMAGPNVYEGIGAAFRTLHESLSDAELAFLVEYTERSIALTEHEIQRLS